MRRIEKTNLVIKCAVMFSLSLLGFQPGQAASDGDGWS